MVGRGQEKGKKERLKNQERWETEDLNPKSNSISIFNKESDLIIPYEHNMHFTEKGRDITYFAIALKILR